jgi:hypothetical protein
METTITPNSSNDSHIQRLQYRDQLIESLDKAEAMMFVFGRIDFNDINERTLKNFASATSDMIRLAVDAVENLDKMDSDKEYSA